MWKKFVKYLKDKNCENEKHEWKFASTKNKNLNLRKCTNCKLTQVETVVSDGSTEWISVLKAFVFKYEFANYKKLKTRIIE